MRAAWQAQCIRAEHGVRSAGCGVRSAECGVRSAKCGVRSAECADVPALPECSCAFLRLFCGAGACSFSMGAAGKSGTGLYSAQACREGGHQVLAVRRRRRGGRVVDRTALLRRHTLKRIVGSNPTLSAIHFYCLCGFNFQSPVPLLVSSLSFLCHFSEHHDAESFAATRSIAFTESVAVMSAK